MERDFALFWVGQTTSAAGDWLLRIALPLYVYSRTGSTTSTAFTFVSATIPGLLLGPVAGALADRWNRRTTMVSADIGRAGMLLLLFIEPSRHVIWLVYLVAAGQGCLSQLFAPARIAVVPTLVPPEEVAAANSAVAAGSELALLGGPVLGGVVYAFAGLRLSVGLDVASYLVSALTIAALRAPAVRQGRAAANGARAGPRAVPAELLSGLRYALDSRALRSLLAVSMISFLGGGLLTVLIVPFARSHLHASGTEYGSILSAQAIGGLLGAFVAKSAIRRLASARLAMTVSLLLIAVAVAVLGTTTAWWAAAACLAFGGVPTTVSAVLTSTVLQTVPRDSHRGRMAGLYGAAAALGLVIGAPVAGVLAASSGLTESVEITAAVFAGSGLIALATFPRSDSPEPEPPTTGGL